MGVTYVAHITVHAQTVDWLALAMLLAAPMYSVKASRQPCVVLHSSSLLSW